MGKKNLTICRDRFLMFKTFRLYRSGFVYPRRSVGQMPCTNLDKNIRVLFVRLIDCNHELFEYVSLYRYLIMWLNYSLLTYGTCDGIVAVIDATGLNWRHIIKLPFGVTGKMLKFMEVRQKRSYLVFFKQNNIL